MKKLASTDFNTKVLQGSPNWIKTKLMSIKP